jgi:hypothetical protein
MGNLRKIFSFICLAALFPTQGCLAAAVAYGAYKISDAKTESAEKAQRSADLRTYANYRTDMERINLDREKASLKPRPIMTQEEWISAQTAGRPPIAPAPSASPVVDKESPQ